MSAISASQLPGDPQPKAQPTGRDNSIPMPKAQGNLSFVLKKVQDVAFEQKERKQLKEGEVEVNIRQTGKCRVRHAARKQHCPHDIRQES